MLMFREDSRSVDYDYPMASRSASSQCRRRYDTAPSSLHLEVEDVTAYRLDVPSSTGCEE